MYEKMKRSIQYALIGALFLGPLAGVANAQEGEGAPEDIDNVLLTFHLIQADGFTDEDPEISDVVSELRKLFNFRGYRLLSTSVFNVGLARRNMNSVVAVGDGSQRIIPGDSGTPLTIKAEISSRRSTGTVRAQVSLTDALRPTGILAAPRLPLLEASVTIRDGQRVVLGSARRSAEDPVLILIVTPRVDPK